MASSQLTDYYNHAFGLKDQHTTNSDHSWFAADIEATIFDLDRYIAQQAGFAASVGTEDLVRVPGGAGAARSPTHERHAADGFGAAGVDRVLEPHRAPRGMEWDAG